MMTRNHLRVIDNLCQQVTDNHDRPFGNKVIVLGGDFRQTLPVIPRSKPETVII
jgi:hypothetical protein